MIDQRDKDLGTGVRRAGVIFSFVAIARSGLAGDGEITPKVAIITVTGLIKWVKYHLVAGFRLLTKHFINGENLIIQWAATVWYYVKIVQCTVNFDLIHAFRKEINHWRAG